MKETRQIIRQQATPAESVRPKIDPETVAKIAATALDCEAKVEESFPDLATYIEQRYTMKPENYTETMKDIIRLMDGYHEVMKTGSNPTQEKQGVQVGKLFLAYNRALRTSESVILMDIILWYFGRYADDTFRGDRPFRAVNMYAFATHEALSFFTHMTAMCQTLHDYKNRHKAIRNMDFIGAVNNIPKGFETQRANMAAVISEFGHL